MNNASIALIFMSMVVVCQAQDLAIETWNQIDKILYPNYKPVISSQQLRYVPAETKMAFKYGICKPFFDAVIQNRNKDEDRLEVEFVTYRERIDELTNMLNQMSTRKNKQTNIELPQSSKASLSKCFGILNSIYTFFVNPIVQLKKVYVCKQIDKLLEQQQLLVRASDCFVQNNRKELILIKDRESKTEYVELSGEQFARCAQYINPEAVLNNKKNEYADKIKNCFRILHNNGNIYNPDGLDPESDPNRDPGNEVCTISYRPFQDMGIPNKSFSEEQLFLLPYIKKCARYAAAYDGYGNKCSQFYADPRYNIQTHGPYGAVFLLSPHEPGYDMTQVGENKTWLRRRSQDEKLWDTCNRYLNAKNNTNNEQYFNSDFLE